MDASVDQQLILQEEFGRAGPQVLSRQALNHIGPIIMKIGKQKQKELHLPKFLSGEIDKGWPLAESLLDWERIGNANPQAALKTLEKYRKSPKLIEKSMTHPLRITYSSPN